MNTETLSAASDLAPALALGNVVTIRGNMRRFVVVYVDRLVPSDLRYNLRALSGGQAGSGPSSMARKDLTLDKDQSVVFTGAQAAKRKRDAHGALLSSAVMLKDVSVYKSVSAHWH